MDYGILDDYIRDPSITKIKLYGRDRGYANIKIKRTDKKVTVIRDPFREIAEYYSFFNRLSDELGIPAEPLFVTRDDTTYEGYTLEIVFNSGSISPYGMPSIAIRKIRKISQAAATTGSQ